ncbi:MAG: hypothetical protein V1754_04060, partial [Pseudomonadota bacterium]
NGFTQRVVGALPPRKIRHSLRIPILLAFTFLGCIIAFALFPGGNYLIQAITDVTNYETWLTKLPIVSLVLVGMMIWGSLAAATSED